MPADLSGLLQIRFSPGVLALGTLLSALFFMLGFLCSISGAAISLSSISALKGMSGPESRKFNAAARLRNKPEKYIGCAYCGVVLNAAFSLTLLSAMYAPLLADCFAGGIDEGTAITLSALIIILLFTVLFTSAACMLPRRIAMSEPEKKLLRYAPVFSFLAAIVSPLYYLSHGICLLISRLTGASGSKTTENQTEEKILKIVDEGEENGTIEENTKSMIENVFDFDDTTVGEIMTHRKDVIAVRDDETLAGLTGTAIDSGKSRIPVYHDDIDDIIGIIYAKDLLKYVGVENGTGSFPREIMRKPVYVPESKSCSEMFSFMTEKKTQIAVVVDEFGGTGGIITMEDLIESILGNIQDEYDNEDDEIKKVNEYSFSVDGATSLDEIEDLTGISFEGDSNDTIAGIMLDRMGHIPKSGEHPSIMINGTRFTVQEVEQRRISKVLVVKSHK